MKNTITACAIGLAVLAVLLNGAICLSASEDNSTLKTFSTAEKATSMKIGGGNKQGMGAGDSGVVVIQNKVTFGKAGKVTNNSRIDNSTGKAGAGNTVHLGTISIKDVIIDGKVSNEAKIRNSENIAIGEDSVATMGSVSITGGAIGKSGMVSNKTTIDSSRNMAMGKSNTAGMGAVIMNTAKVDGKVENRSQVDTATNITKGENNTAGVGTTTLHNSKLGKGGTLLNTSDTRKSANIGIGINNKTHAGAVQVE